MMSNQYLKAVNTLLSAIKISHENPFHDIEGGRIPQQRKEIICLFLIGIIMLELYLSLKGCSFFWTFTKIILCYNIGILSC